MVQQGHKQKCSAWFTLCSPPQPIYGATHSTVMIEKIKAITCLFQSTCTNDPLARWRHCCNTVCYPCYML